MVNYKNLLIIFILFISCGSQGEKSLFNPKEKKWINRNSIIRVAPAPQFPPMDITSNDGTYKGISFDFLKKISKVSGLQFKIVQLKDWNQLIDFVKEGKVDVVTSIQQTEERNTFLYFTLPYIILPNKIITRKDFEHNLLLSNIGRDMKLSVVKGYAVEKYIKDNYPDITIDPVVDITAAIRRVSFGYSEAMVANLASISYIIDKENITNLRIAGDAGYTWSLRFGISKKNSNSKILYSIIDKSLSALSSEEKNRIKNKWISISVPSFWQSKIFWISVGSIFFVISIILSALFGWSMRLKRLLKVRSNDLEMELNIRHEKEIELKVSDDRYRAIFNAVNDVILLHHPQSGLIIGANNKVHEMYGYDVDDLLGKSIGLISSGVYPYTEKNAMALLAKAARGIPQSFEWQAQNIQGTVFWIDVNMTVALIGEEKLVIAVVRDIDEKKKADDHLLQTQKMEMVNTLAGGLAHDFNNLLSAIKGTSSLMLLKMQDEKMTDEEIVDRLNVIENSTDRAASLVKKLLTLSRRYEPNFETLDLNAVINNVVSICESTLDKSINIVTELYSDEAPVLGDPTQIEQVLLNLLMNGAHAMTIMRKTGFYGGDLIIDLEKKNIVEDDVSAFKWMLTVKDSGVGITKENLQNIFTPFFTTKEKGAGTGLGLAMVYSIMEKHNGKITVESTPGEGSEFQLHFPCYDGAVEEVKSSEIKFDDLKGISRALVVDDEEIMIKTFRILLKEFQIESIVFSNGEDACRYLEDNKKNVDVIFLDLSMPGMSGKETYNCIKEIDDSIPVILASGFEKDVRVKETLQMGAKAFLHKPFGVKDIYKVLSEILK